MSGIKLFLSKVYSNGQKFSIVIQQMDNVKKVYFFQNIFSNQFVYKNNNSSMIQCMYSYSFGVAYVYKWKRPGYNLIVMPSKNYNPIQTTKPHFQHLLLNKFCS